MQYSQQALEKMTLRIKELKEENKAIREKIPSQIKQRETKLTDLQNKDRQYLAFEQSHHRQMQKMKQTLQQKQDELNDWNTIITINKDDLLQKKQELNKILEEVRNKNAEMTKIQEEVYEEFANKRKEALQQEKMAAEKAKNDILKSFEEIVELVKVEKKNEAFTPETLKSIFYGLAVYMSDSFSKLIEDYRLERRTRKYNNKQLLQSFKAHEEKIKALIAEKQKEYLKKLDIPFEFILKSINYHASKGNKEVNQLFSFLTLKLKTLQKSKKDLNKEELKTAWKLKKTLLHKHQIEFLDLLNECQRARILPDQGFSIAQLKLGDYLFAELKVEEEDFMKAHKLIDSTGDQELKHLVFILPQEIQKIMRERLSK